MVMDPLIMLREATPHDLLSIQELYQESIMTSCRADYNEQQLHAWAAGAGNQDRWHRAIRDQYFRLAHIDGQLAGFGSLDGSYLDFMFVKPRFQGKGVAHQIYEQLEGKALGEGMGEITADVSKTARSFFEKQGFTVVQTNQNLIRGVEIVNYHMVKSFRQ